MIQQHLYTSYRRFPARRPVRKALLIVVAALAILFATACEDKSQSYIAEFEYFRDSATGLCFARVLYCKGYSTSSISCVPCDSVAHLLAGGER